MRTKKLCEITGLCRATIWKMVREKQIRAVPVGGRHGYEFPEDTPKKIELVLKRRHEERVKRMRLNRELRRLENPLAFPVKRKCSYGLNSDLH